MHTAGTPYVWENNVRITYRTYIWYRTQSTTTVVTMNLPSCSRRGNKQEKGKRGGRKLDKKDREKIEKYGKWRKGAFCG